MMHRYLILFVFFYVHLITWGQEQYLRGRVEDAQTESPIAFVNIVYGDGAGTVTDIDGRFEIRTWRNVQELKLSCLGYAPLVLPIDELQPDGVIYLKPQKYSLAAVDVLPSENPALAIMRGVVEKKDLHNPDNYAPFSCILYHKMTLDFEWPAVLNEEERAELKDSLGIQNDSYLFLFESVSEKKHLKKGVGKERVISGRVSGLKDPLLASFPAMLQPFSFYDPTIKLLGYSYLNPASRAGLGAYQFILQETYSEQGDTVFYITYRPQRDRNFRGLTGAFHIDGRTMAIKTVSATTTGTENGMRLFIRQKYQPANNGKWFPKQLESSLQLGGLGLARRLPFPIVGKGKSYVTAINTQASFSPSEFDNIVLEDLSGDRDAPDLERFRYSPLTARDSLTYQFLDSIGRRNHLDALIKTQVSMIKGYLPIGKLQLNLSKLIDYNNFEGFKLGLGLYTSPEVSPYFSTGGYFTYGFGDKDEKYGLSLSLTPFENKENRFFVSYQDDVHATGSYAFLDGVKAMSSERFSRFLTETMDLSKGWRSGAEFRFLKYWKGGLYFTHFDIAPQMPYRFAEAGDVAADFTMDELAVKLKWAQRETFARTAFGKMSNGTNWPIIWLNAASGKWEAAESYEYRRYEARAHKQFNYPNAMYTVLRVEGGLMNGDYPSTLLYSSLGSYKSFTVRVPYTFGTMRLNEFGADRFAALYFSHGFPMGLNTNRRIKPEIVVSTNVAFGEAPDGVTSLNKGYYESGLYLKNLFSNFVFQYGLSVHYRYGPYRLPDGMDNWAIKLGLEFSF
ncbi:MULTISPECIES: DUF5686 family protein [unclassified Carboxylicivirga]|uniref:DUF5686 family protein n=1 Tax=Carboxylicivirga TaxID=1628153 RepID=UPI003D357D49